MEWIELIFYYFTEQKGKNLDQNNCLQPLQISDVENELVPALCTSAKIKYK